MAFIETWDESVPAGSRALNLGDDDIRAFKTAIRERLQFGGMYFPSSDDALAGEHDYVRMTEQSADPTNVGNKGFVYVKDDGSGNTELYYMDDDGTVVQLTAAGKINIAAFGIDSEAQGDLIVRGASAWQRLAVGNNGEVLTTDGTDPSWGTVASVLPSGARVQYAYSQTGSYSSGTTAMPADNTIPQITEGDQFMSLAITPTDATNILKIEVVVHADASVSNEIIAALFQDSTANALACGAELQRAGNEMVNIKFTHFMVAGTAASTTFRVRVGAQNGTLYFNGVNGTQRYGGVVASSISIEEIKV